VRERPLFLILDRTTMSAIQVVAALFGIPGLLIFFLSRWFERREQGKTRRTAGRAIGPQGGIQKPRKLHP
jgi:hypothetical protein